MEATEGMIRAVMYEAAKPLLPRDTPGACILDAIDAAVKARDGLVAAVGARAPAPARVVVHLTNQHGETEALRCDVDGHPVDIAGPPLYVTRVQAATR